MTHTHESSHSTMVLEGTQIVGEVHLRPGDYGYGGDSAHHVVAASDGGREG